MINYHNAKTLAENYLRDIEKKLETKVCLLENETSEHSFGWIFYYNSSEFAATKDLSYALFGNGPLLVDKEKQILIPLGTAYPIEHYIAQYIKNGKIE